MSRTVAVLEYGPSPVPAYFKVHVYSEHAELELFECDKCGAVVSDKDFHESWHWQLSMQLSLLNSKLR